MKFYKEIRQQLGFELMKERHKRKLLLHQVANACNLKAEKIDYLELGCRINPLEDYQILLDYYGKQLELEIVDKEISG